MGAGIRIRDFSVFFTPPPGALMGMLKGWFDDSRTEPLWAVGGYVGGLHQWEHFEKYWPKALEAAGVPYFHMKEWARPNGIYAKWHPPQDHRKEVAEFMASLAAVVRNSYLHGISSIVRIADLERFNREKRLELEAYPLAVYGCLLLIDRYAPERAEIEIVFDRVEKAKSKIDIAEGYGERDSFWKKPRSVSATVLAEGIPLSCVPALQAADLFAWEFRKHQERVGDWHLMGDIPVDADAAWEQMEKWILSRYPSHEAIARKSVIALIENGNFSNLVWDYRTLNEVHELRRGVW